MVWFFIGLRSLCIIFNMPYGSENEGRGLDDRPINWAPPCLRPKEKSPIPFIPWRTCQTWLISLVAFVCFLPGLSCMIGGGKKVMCTSKKFNFPSIMNYGRKCFNVKKKRKGEGIEFQCAFDVTSTMNCVSKILEHML